MDHIDSHPFWGKKAPFSQAAYIPFLLCTSTRLSIAIISTAALIWTFILSSVSILAAKRLIPSRFKVLVYVFISSFWTLVFGILISLFSPILFLEIQFPLALTAVVFIFSGLGDNVESENSSSVMKKSIIQSIIIGGIILLFSLVREPFGFGALSLPSSEGIAEILTSEVASDMAIRTVALTSGGLILLGVVVGFYRIFKEMYIIYYSRRENQ